MTTTMTPDQATAEAVLLLTRKLRRLHPEALAEVMGRLPEGARTALHEAETRADVLRARAGGVANLAYPEVEDFGDE